MAVANGYGKVVTSGSVFMYDTGDTINSYMGEPTTNLINPNAPNIYTWWSRSIQTITQLSETYKGNPIYRVTLSLDTSEQTSYANSRWGAGTGWYMPYITYTANTPYIASVVYRPVSHSDLRVYGHPSNISGWGLTVDDSIDLDGGWKQHRIDRNYGTTVSDNRFHHMHAPTATTGQTIVIDITCSQIESKAHATPFVNGTRSATQGLLPVIGNSAIDLTNVSFDSNAQMVFDGTNDRITLTPSNYGITNQFTIEVICNPTQALATGMFNFLGTVGDRGIMCHWPWTDGNIYFDVHNTSGTFHRWYKTINIVNQTALYHIMINSSGQMIVKQNNVVLSPNNASTFSGTVAIGSTNTIGAFNPSGGNPWAGTINMFKVYNRALTDAETTQNYNKYKSRFNLS